MSVAYLDTSALVKQYVIELGTDWIKQLLVPDQTPGVFTSHLTVSKRLVPLRAAGAKAPCLQYSTLRFFARLRMTFKTGTTFWTWSQLSSKLRGS